MLINQAYLQFIERIQASFGSKTELLNSGFSNMMSYNSDSSHSFEDAFKKSFKSSQIKKSLQSTGFKDIQANLRKP
jgi:hypothetical protein